MKHRPAAFRLGYPLCRIAAVALLAALAGCAGGGPVGNNFNGFGGPDFAGAGFADGPGYVVPALNNPGIGPGFGGIMGSGIGFR